MAFGNEAKDYGTTTGKTGFYGCHAEPFRRDSTINEEQKTQQKQRLPKLGDELTDIVNDLDLREHV